MIGNLVAVQLITIAQLLPIVFATFVAIKIEIKIKI